MTLKEYFGNSKVLILLISINILIASAIGLSSFFPSPAAESTLMSWLVMPGSWKSFIATPWSAVTYMFTQTSFLHLLFNMLWLLWFGRIFIYVGSDKQLLLTYICGGLTGALCFLAACSFATPVPGIYLTGASASVLAVMTAASVAAPNLELNLLLLGQIRLKYVALLCIVLTFLGIGGGNAGSFSAHIGGVIFGLFAPGIFSHKQTIRIHTPSFMRRLVHKLKSRKRRVPEILRKPVNAPSSISDEERLDQLLDKVRVSGYDSLSSSEKSELNAISSRL